VSQRFKDILDWQPEIDIDAFLARAKFNDGGFIIREAISQ